MGNAACQRNVRKGGPVVSPTAVKLRRLVGESDEPSVFKP